LTVITVHFLLLVPYYQQVVAVAVMESQPNKMVGLVVQVAAVAAVILGVMQLVAQEMSLQPSLLVKEMLVGMVLLLLLVAAVAVALLLLVVMPQVAWGALVVLVKHQRFLARL
jgi:hypothetical protein